MKTKKVSKKKKKVVKKKELPKKDLTFVGFAVIMNKDKNCYDLVTLNFHPETKQAYVSNIEKLCDHHYQAKFKIQKMLAHDQIVPIQ